VAPADVPGAQPAVFVFDHTDGTLQSIAIPADASLPRVPIGVTATNPPVVLMAKARPLGATATGGTTVAYLDFELWSIDTGHVTPLPSSPPGITPFSAAISPDGEHLAMAWTTGDGALQLGVAAIDDIVASDGAWAAGAWSVHTLADGDPLGRHSALVHRPVCWCRDRIVVITPDRVYAFDVQ
jgi:hypothetical protein